MRACDALEWLSRRDRVTVGHDACVVHRQIDPVQLLCERRAEASGVTGVDDIGHVPPETPLGAYPEFFQPGRSPLVGSRSVWAYRGRSEPFERTATRN